MAWDEVKRLPGDKLNELLALCREDEAFRVLYEGPDPAKFLAALKDDSADHYKAMVIIVPEILERIGELDRARAVRRAAQFVNTKFLTSVESIRLGLLQAKTPTISLVARTIVRDVLDFFRHKDSKAEELFHNFLPRPGVITAEERSCAASYLEKFEEAATAVHTKRSTPLSELSKMPPSSCAGTAENMKDLIASLNVNIV